MTSFMQKENEEREKRNPPHTPFPAGFLYENKKKELAFLSPLQGRRSSSFLLQKTKKRKEKENPCCASSLFSTERMTESLFLFSFWNRKGKRRGTRSSSFPDLSFWKAWISLLSLLTEVIMSSFLLLKTKIKNKRTPASICRNRLPFSYRQKKKEKENNGEPSFPSSGKDGREDGSLL